eukprot:CAMPEP_0181174046 /NCGR_PEP_ID=MMETSP1096-20121128/3324_1 /TAXON_ID=156174 ORGANISM="Chrysochromulina ericina, Strain CCMP281" /NCGR_SAMPLE_ID=MMETSP1096 /ASSEMBLY_ACC=CAM_ASM_000453 /LENGTH=111 /DNA_ID=CAMNT_0023261915 /DNA_START=92 /DNA_END=427 /DNA_ORIENTATION=-
MDATAEETQEEILLDSVVEGRMHIRAGQFNLTSAQCPTKARFAPDFTRCFVECFEGFHCEQDEICCRSGCSQICQKEIMPPHYEAVGMVFAAMLVCGWAVACGTTSLRFET